MSKVVGKDGKVTLAANSVVGMGTWSLDGISTEQFDQSAFGDEWKTFLYGMKDGGTVSFNGHYDPADTTGQEELQKANILNSAISNLRMYVDNTSYWEPCQTTGYYNPNNTTGMGTVLSTVMITDVKIGLDKSGLGTISFTGKVSGCMVLV